MGSSRCVGANYARRELSLLLPGWSRAPSRRGLVCGRERRTGSGADWGKTPRFEVRDLAGQSLSRDHIARSSFGLTKICRADLSKPPHIMRWRIGVFRLNSGHMSDGPSDWDRSQPLAAFGRPRFLPLGTLPWP